MARIFNTFGPRMRLDDGRVVSNFVIQVRMREREHESGREDESEGGKPCHSLTTTDIETDADNNLSPSLTVTAS